MYIVKRPSYNVIQNVTRFSDVLPSWRWKMYYRKYTYKYICIWWYLHIYKHIYAYVRKAKFHMHHFRERCRESTTVLWKGRHGTSTGFSSRHSRRGFAFEGIQNFTQFSVEKSNTRILFKHNYFSFIQLICTQCTFFLIITTIIDVVL